MWSERHTIGGLQTLEESGVGRCQPPSAEPSVRDEQAIERVARPGQLDRLSEPGRRRRVVEQPAVVVGQPLERPASQANAADLDQKLKLQERRRRHVELWIGLQQHATPGMSLLQPDQCVRVEKNHDVTARLKYAVAVSVERPETSRSTSTVPLRSPDRPFR